MSGARKAFVIFVTVIVLVVIGLIVGSFVAQSSAKSAARDAVARMGFENAEKLEVKNDGFFFLPQVISGKLNGVSLSADTVTYTVEGAPITISDFKAHVQGLTTREPYIADNFSGSGLITTSSIQNLVNAKGLKMTVEGQQGSMKLSSSIMGVPVQVLVTATPTIVKSADLTRDVAALEFKASDLSINLEKFVNQKNTVVPAQPSESSSEKNSNTTEDSKKSSNDKNSMSSSKNSSSSKNNSSTKSSSQPKELTLAEVLGNFQPPTFVVPLTQLPSGVEITGIEMTEQGVKLQLSGSTVNLSGGAVNTGVPATQVVPAETNAGATQQSTAR